MKRLAKIVNWVLSTSFELVILLIGILGGTMIACYLFSMFTDKF